MTGQAGPYPRPLWDPAVCSGCVPDGEPHDPPMCLHLLHVVGHLLGQVLQELLSDHVGADLLRRLAGEDSTVELPGPWLGLCQEVLLWAQRE